MDGPSKRLTVNQSLARLRSIRAQQEELDDDKRAHDRHSARRWADLGPGRNRPSASPMRPRVVGSLGVGPCSDEEAKGRFLKLAKAFVVRPFALWGVPLQSSQTSASRVLGVRWRLGFAEAPAAPAGRWFLAALPSLADQ